MASIEREFGKRTWALEYNPNCPMQYLVRLIGKGKATIDHLPPARTADILGYGKTFEEARSAALKEAGVEVEYLYRIRIDRIGYSDTEEFRSLSDDRAREKYREWIRVRDDARDRGLHDLDEYGERPRGLYRVIRREKLVQIAD